MVHLLIIAAAGLAAIGWVIYFRWKDAEHPEPVWLMIAVALGGVGAAFLALLKYIGLEKLGLPTDWSDLGGANLVHAASIALRIGFIEETCKLLPVVPVVLFTKQIDEPLDGLVYAGCAGLGLATAETAIQVFNGAFGLWDGLARAATGPISHALFAAPWGLGMARYALDRRKWPFAVGLAVSIACHATYDLLLARPELPPVAAAVVVLGLWGWLIWISPKLARERDAVPAPAPG